MTTFAELGLPEIILKSLENINYTTPTPIQEQAIPLALEGKDVLGSAQTGTGKTAAFGLPLIAFLMKNTNSTALVLTPTRELATQVMDSINKMIPLATGIKSTLLIGGDSMRQQLNGLARRPRIIVGTPGRINDHLKRGSLNLAKANFLVLDETDRMLDMGFGPQLEAIAKFLPKERQNLMFSATMPKNIMKLSEKYLNNPVRVTIGELNAVAVNVKQEVLRVSEAVKYDLLVSQLGERKGSVVIFVKTKHGADRLAKKLNGTKHTAAAIHGNLSQNQRDAVIKAFRVKEYRILVATDIAARGLDIPHIEHVINYDLPQVPEDYIHRIGRTARAGADGSAICLLSPKDELLWKAIYKMLNPGKTDPNAPAGKLMPQAPRGRGRGGHSKSNANGGQGKSEGATVTPMGFRAKQQAKKQNKGFGGAGDSPYRGKVKKSFGPRKRTFSAKKG